MKYMSRCIVLLSLALCCACVSINKKAVDLNCNDFDVELINNSFGELLFFDDLKKAVLSKLRILAKDNKQNADRKICKMRIDVARSKFMSIINDTGDTGQENTIVGVSYELSLSDKAITGYVETFYGNSISGYPYSNYIKNKKNKKNEIEILAEDIFMDIVKQVN